jgi:hypothetical protein
MDCECASDIGTNRYNRILCAGLIGGRAYPELENRREDLGGTKIRTDEGVRMKRWGEDLDEDRRLEAGIRDRQ